MYICIYVYTNVKWLIIKADVSFAVSEIEGHCSTTAAVSKWKDPEKQTQNTTLVEQSGQRTVNSDVLERKPYEKDQFIIKKVTKFGWDKDDAKDCWQDMLRENHPQDNKGRHGGTRLWLSKESMLQTREKYKDLAENIASETIKNATAEDHEALRMHIHERAATDLFNSDDFLKGKSGIRFPNEASGSGSGGAGGVKRKREDGAADCDEDGERV